MVTTMTDLIASHLGRIAMANYSPITVRDREEVLRRLDQDLLFGLAGATIDELQDWLTQRSLPAAERRWCDETRRTYYNHIIGFFQDPYIKEQIGYDPSAGLIRPKPTQYLPKPVTDEELAYALARLPRPWSTYCAIAAYAGLRAGELAGLHRRNITERAILVDHGKGGKSRTVEMSPDLWPRVRLLPSGPIALLGSGRVMTAEQMSARVRYRLDQIGLPEVTLHRFRHWFASTLVQAGVNLLVVSELMGHANPNSTKIYALITSEQRRLAVRALPALAPAPN
jgi:integrase/recombinase XerD